MTTTTVCSAALQICGGLLNFLTPLRPPLLHPISRRQLGLHRGHDCSPFTAFSRGGSPMGADAAWPARRGKRAHLCLWSKWAPIVKIKSLRSHWWRVKDPSLWFRYMSKDQLSYYLELLTTADKYESPSVPSALLNISGHKTGFFSSSFLIV